MILTIVLSLFLTAIIILLAVEYDIKNTELKEEKRFIKVKNALIDKLARESLVLNKKNQDIQSKLDTINIENYRQSKRNKIFFSTETNTLIESDSLVEIGTL